VLDTNTRSKLAGSRGEPELSAAVERTCILVLGMHRSGTSALTRILSLAGATLPKRLLQANSSNKTGHWEPKILTELNDKLLREIGSSWHNWSDADFAELSKERAQAFREDVLRILDEEYSGASLFVLKDPRICRLAPFFLSTLTDAGIRPIPILIFRNPLDVMLSLEKRSQNWPEPYCSADGAMLWLRHVLDAELATRGMARGFTSYEALLVDWRDSLDKLSQQTGLVFPRTFEDIAYEVDAFLSREYCHQQHSKDEFDLNPITRGWLGTAYDACEELIHSPECSQSLTALDRVHQGVLGSMPILTSLFNERVELTELRRELKTKEKELQNITNSKYRRPASPLHYYKRIQLAVIDNLRAARSSIKHGGGIVSASRKGLNVLRREGVVGLKKRLASRVIADQKLRTSGTPISSFIELLAPTKMEVFKLDEPVTVVVPVYNGLEHLEKLIPTLLASVRPPHRIIFVNDASPDDRISPFLSELSERHDHIKVWTNEKNLGFVGTVNRATADLETHFVLLNTDTMLPQGWLERLMRPIIQNNGIASTTPFSNAATIFSFPAFPEDSELIAGLDVHAIDNVFGSTHLKNNIKLTAPTGVGFCMGVNRAAWMELGGFDAETFGKGYGEENDWCQRAQSKGYENTLVPNLFVHHAHGGSFTPQEKTELIARNLKVLDSRWPEYLPSVHRHISEDPWRSYRNAAFLKLCCAHSPMLIFDHKLGGGANLYRDSLLRQAQEHKRPTLLLTYDTIQNIYVLDAKFGDHCERYFADKPDWIAKLSPHFNNCEIVYNNLVSWPEPEQSLNLINSLAEMENVKATILFHDYFPVCPSYTLLNSENKYCGVPSDEKVCNVCLKKHEEKGSAFLYKPRDVGTWRSLWQSLIDNAHEIVFFSNASRDITQRGLDLPEDRTFVRAHSPLSHFRPLTGPQTEKLVIGIVGNLSYAKGAEITAELSRNLASCQPAAQIVVLGATDTEKYEYLPNVITHGSFDHAELRDLMMQYGVNVGLQPSVWPETFSYSVQEMMQLDLPVVCFDLGAPAERLKAYSKGFVASSISVEALQEAIETAWEGVRASSRAQR
jgi:GT2 family glycosyltransferase